MLLPLRSRDRKRAIVDSAEMSLMLLLSRSKLLQIRGILQTAEAGMPMPPAVKEVSDLMLRSVMVPVGMFKAARTAASRAGSGIVTGTVALGDPLTAALKALVPTALAAFTQ